VQTCCFCIPLQTALQALNHLLRNPRVVGGGGVFELYLARLVRQTAEEMVCDASNVHVKSARVQAANLFASCLEDMFRGLCGPDLDIGSTTVHSLSKTAMEAVQDHLKQSIAGWNPVEDCLISATLKDGRSGSSGSDSSDSDSEDCDKPDVVVDLLSSRAFALEKAVETAVSILRISGVVKMKT
jgi:chaperonin GroEL (HSP60 family)